MRFLALFLFVVGVGVFSKNELVAKEIRRDGAFAGVEKFTVTTGIYPHSLYVPMRDALISELKKIGQVVVLESSEEIASAMVNTTMLELSIDNRLTDSKQGNALKFAVNLNIALESISDSKQVVWLAEDEIPFSPKGNVLIDEGVKSVKKIAAQFSEIYKKTNPEKENKRPTFYLL